MNIAKERVSEQHSDRFYNNKLNERLIPVNKRAVRLLMAALLLGGVGLSSGCVTSADFNAQNTRTTENFTKVAGDINRIGTNNLTAVAEANKRLENRLSELDNRIRTPIPAPVAFTPTPERITPVPTTAPRSEPTRVLATPPPGGSSPDTYEFLKDEVKIVAPNTLVSGDVCFRARSYDLSCIYDTGEGTTGDMLLVLEEPVEIFAPNKGSFQRVVGNVQETISKRAQEMYDKGCEGSQGCKGGVFLTTIGKDANGNYGATPRVRIKP